MLVAVLPSLMTLELLNWRRWPRVATVGESEHEGLQLAECTCAPSAACGEPEAMVTRFAGLATACGRVVLC